MRPVWAVLSALLALGASSAEAQGPAPIELTSIVVRPIERGERAPRGVASRIGEVRPAIENCAEHGGTLHARWVPEAADVATITVDHGLPRDERRCVLALLAELDIVPVEGTAGFDVTLRFVEPVEMTVFEGEVIDLEGYESGELPSCGCASADRMATVAVETVVVGTMASRLIRLPVTACFTPYRRHRRELVGHRFRITLRGSFLGAERWEPLE